MMPGICRKKTWCIQLHLLRRKKTRGDSYAFSYHEYTSQQIYWKLMQLTYTDTDSKRNRRKSSQKHWVLLFATGITKGAAKENIMWKHDWMKKQMQQLTNVKRLGHWSFISVELTRMPQQAEQASPCIAGSLGTGVARQKASESYQYSMTTLHIHFCWW